MHSASATALVGENRKRPAQQAKAGVHSVSHAIVKSHSTTQALQALGAKQFNQHFH